MKKMLAKPSFMLRSLLKLDTSMVVVAWLIYLIMASDAQGTHRKRKNIETNTRFKRRKTNKFFFRCLSIL